ncbi:alkaline phosphatase family protein [Evansella halocellulosilytica]|uniref:alkaline phosphatase family protein n=1 Tax=Evansella halocellulosilytica TaxID=2011013 RepID=UPI000BB950A9|nr:alkaline phosphatase family protein [Evansella halocellulosilytica]
MERRVKPIILIIIDTLMSTPLEEAVQTGMAPALQFFMQKGSYFPNIVSSFPTMSVTIESSLLTGTYSDSHLIPALIWFHEKEKRIINYGTGVKEVMKTGFSQFVKDMFYNLNNKHLNEQVKTIHEELADRGQSSASINAFVYRGNTIHKMHLPKLIQAFTRYNEIWEVKAPTLWSLGSFSKFSSSTKTPQKFSGNYKAGFQELKYLIRNGLLTDFTLCVIQDLDLRVHIKGPMDLKGIKKIDRELQNVLNLFPSWEDAINECTWVILSDNGHASMGKKKEPYVIDLRKLLRGYSIMRGTFASEKNELALAVNQRTAFIYCLKKEINKKSVIEQLKDDTRLDIIAWYEDNKTNVVSGEQSGTFSFYKGGTFFDQFGQSWTIEGNEKLLNLAIKSNEIIYNHYPDALARLSSSLHSHGGDYIVVTAKPGYEFKEKSSPLHVGGAAHGSLHKQESLVPMIVAGTEVLPEHERIIDLKPWILRLLNNNHQ